MERSKGGYIAGCVDRNDIHLRRVQSQPKLRPHLKALHLRQTGRVLMAGHGSRYAELSQGSCHAVRPSTSSTNKESMGSSTRVAE